MIWYGPVIMQDIRLPTLLWSVDIRDAEAQLANMGQSSQHTLSTSMGEALLKKDIEEIPVSDNVSLAASSIYDKNTKVCPHRNQRHGSTSSFITTGVQQFAL